VLELKELNAPYDIIDNILVEISRDMFLRNILESDRDYVEGYLKRS